MTTIEQRLLAEGQPSETAVALTLMCWRRWFPAAIADGTARPHLETVAGMIVATKIRRIYARGNLKLFKTGLAPSAPALQSGWPVSRAVPLLLVAADGELTPARAEQALALLYNRAGSAVRNRLILTESLAADCPREFPRRGQVSGAHVHTIDELDEQLPRARALVAPLRKIAARQTAKAAPAQEAARPVARAAKPVPQARASTRTRQAANVR